ncbi:MAG: hypothetical protein KBA02_00210 [Paludibacteraceae bacterium]|nr:hypothetical protein [Paludibacteraceae bacterium]
MTIEKLIDDIEEHKKEVNVVKKQHKNMLARIQDLENQSPNKVLEEAIKQVYDILDNNGGTIALIVSKASQHDMNCCYEEDSCHYKEAKASYLLTKSILFIFVIAVTLALPIALFVPSSKTISAMYLIPKITANEQVQQIPDKVLQIMNGKLDEWIEDLSKEKK